MVEGERHGISFIYDFDNVHISKATYDKKYIRTTIQTMYSISKSTFKLTKPVEIYKVHHYEIVGLTHGFKLFRAQLTNTSINDENNKQKYKCNNVKIIIGLV